MMIITRSRIIKHCCTCFAVATAALGLMHLLIISTSTFPEEGDDGHQNDTVLLPPPSLQPSTNPCSPLCDHQLKTAVLKSPSDLCNSHFQLPIDLIILVHSATDHFAQRAAIRHFSSPSQSRFGGQHWRTVFVLGKTANNSSIERAISEEDRSFGDLLQGNFLDSYRNLTVKHLFGLGWTVQQQQQQKCSSIRAVLKVDDDIFVNYYRLAALLKQSNFLSNSSSSSTPSLLCYLHRRMPVNRDRGSSQFSSKWSVTREEFSEAYYPPFCSGWAYLTTPETIHRWLCAVPKTRFFWIDDVYVTGMLRKNSCPGSGQERRGVQPINHLYSVDPGQVASWLQEEEDDIENIRRPQTLKKSTTWFYLFSNTDSAAMLRAALQRNRQLHRQLSSAKRQLKDAQNV